MKNQVIKWNLISMFRKLLKLSKKDPSLLEKSFKYLKLFSILVILITLKVPSLVFSSNFIDKNSSIFFPNEFDKKLRSYNSFPITWWNFLIIQDEKKASADFCLQLKRKLGKWARRIECGESISSFSDVLQDWARDLPIRRKIPSDKKLKWKLDKAMAKMSWMMGKRGREFVDLLRMDPFESHQELLNIVRKKKIFDWPSTDDKNSNHKEKMVIPIQMGHPPLETEKTQAFMRKLSNDKDLHLIGLHASSWENQKRVMDDMVVVSIIGSVIFIAFALFIFISGRARLFLLIPPVVLAVTLSGLLTVMIFGSIHGLTISFGVGIIGLSFDYAFHSIFGLPSRRIWYSNIIGLVTTIVVLLIISMSTIPLLRQMMFFSIIGLVIAFILFFVFQKLFPQYYFISPLEVAPKRFKGQTAALLLCLFGVLLGLYYIKPDLGMHQFDYRSDKTVRLQKWFYKNLKGQGPYFGVYDNNDGIAALKKAHLERDWAYKHSIQIENIANYLPTLKKQQENLSSWKEKGPYKICKKSLRPYGKLFTPFYKMIDRSCESQKLRPGKPLPSYLGHLHSKGKWLTFWLPKSKAQVKRLKKRWPKVVSLKELVMQFPKRISKEFLWMIPLSLLCVGTVLFIYYRKMWLVFIAMVPFFTAIGLISWSVIFLGMKISFISLMAFLMVYGLSVDYGIFACDACINIAEDNKRKKGIWSALLFAALSTISGFVPLAFCKHQVLAHLGQTLTVGTLGTLLGAFWGVPVFIKLLNEKMAKINV